MVHFGEIIMFNLAYGEKMFAIRFSIICNFDRYGIDFRILPRTILRYGKMTIFDKVDCIEIEHALI